MAIVQVKKQDKGYRQSHFNHAHKFFADGLEKFKVVWGKDIPKTSPYISTSYHNPDGSCSQAFLAIHLRYSNSSKEWHKDGMLSFEKVKHSLMEDLSEVWQWVVAITRDPNGKDLHVVLCFSPYKIACSKHEKSSKTFFQLGKTLMRILGKMGMGPNFSALKENWYTVNWKNSKYRLGFYPENLKKANSALEAPGKRLSMLGSLLSDLRQHPLEAYQKKSDVYLEKTSDLLYPDIRVEKKLAELFCYLEESSERVFSGTWRDFRKCFKLNYPTLKKLVDFGVELPCGLFFFSKDRKIYVTLRESEDFSYSDRARGLMDGSLERFSCEALPKPFELDSSRPDLAHGWLISALCCLKHSGVSKARALKILSNALRDFPGFEKSFIFRTWQYRVDSFYRNKAHLFGFNEDLLVPDWLLDYEAEEESEELTNNTHSKSSKN